MDIVIIQMKPNRLQYRTRKQLVHVWFQRSNNVETEWNILKHKISTKRTLLMKYGNIYQAKLDFLVQVKKVCCVYIEHIFHNRSWGISHLIENDLKNSSSVFDGRFNNPNRYILLHSFLVSW